MAKIFVGFWQCILAQILLVCLIDLPFLLFGLTGFGVLKIILFLYTNYKYKILPHPTDHFNLFAFTVEERFPEEITKKKGKN